MFFFIIEPVEFERIIVSENELEENLSIDEEDEEDDEEEEENYYPVVLNKK